MSEIKTKVTDADVNDFITAVPDDKKRADALVLLELFKRVTSEPPKMWGPSMIGFGQYHYKSERSSQEGDWLLTGFSPRKQALTLYILHGLDEHTNLLKKLGKHKAGKGCLYINKLDDVDLAVLEELVTLNYKFMKQRYT
jgi:hypothetical protein